MSLSSTPPPDDRSMWRKLLRLAHPDTGGDEELFVWVRSLQEYVDSRGDLTRDPLVDLLTRAWFTDPPAGSATTRRSTSKPKKERSDELRGFDASLGFEGIKRRALDLADSGEIPEPYAGLFRLLSDAEEPDPMTDPQLAHETRFGARYPFLKEIAAVVGFASDRDRLGGWYAASKRASLSQAHARHILDRLKEGEA